MKLHTNIILTNVFFYSLVKRTVSSSNEVLSLLKIILSLLQEKVLFAHALALFESCIGS